jgi:hypothetical protein
MPKKIEPRSLEDCLNARWPVKGGWIYCREGHKFGSTGQVKIQRVFTGKYHCSICQYCHDFIDMREVKDAC